MYKVFDADGNEVEVTAEDLVRRAVEEGWTISSDVAAAIKELLGWDK